MIIVHQVTSKLTVHWAKERGDQENGEEIHQPGENAWRPDNQHYVPIFSLIFCVKCNNLNPLVMLGIEFNCFFWKVVILIFYEANVCECLACLATTCRPECHWPRCRACSMQRCRRLARAESAGALPGLPGTTGSQLFNCQIIINLYFARK